MRTFVALEAGREFLESLLQALSPLKEKYPYFRWVPKENLHITLAFLGEIDEAFLPLVKEAAKGAADCGKISVTGGKLFTLPPRGDANVLALGFESGGEEIALLAEKLKENLEIRGIMRGGTERKRFLPHITLARKGRAPIRISKEDQAASVRGVFSSLGVYKSELLPQGARYTVLAAYPLSRIRQIKR